MRKYILICILSLISFPSFSTGQAGDILIFENKKYELLDTPLESYPQIDSIRDNLFGGKDGGLSTACWRGYIAEWTIENEKIFLTNIYSYNYFSDGDSLKSNLKDLFGEKCIGNKVKADWISKELLVADGEMILYHHDAFIRFYEKERGFFIENGNLIDVVDYDNSKMKKSEYFENSELLLPFIYSNIQWDSIPELTNEKERVVINFSSGESEKPENIEVLRGSTNPVFNEEAKRVIGLLKWNVYYKKGKPKRFRYTIPVIFSQEYKDKYWSSEKNIRDNNNVGNN